VSEGFGLEKKAVREKEKRPVKGAKFLIE